MNFAKKHVHATNIKYHIYLEPKWGPIFWKIRSHKPVMKVNPSKKNKKWVSWVLGIYI